MDKVLIVGSWAKEQATIENIVNIAGSKAYVYMDTPNPGIMALVNDYRIGDLKDTKNIVDYADSISADLVLVTTASPLAVGLVDSLREKGIKVFGPTRSAARLEYDKAFARKLMAKYCPEAIPEFGIFDCAEATINFAKEHGWQVAVKYIGLAEGLGVKVFGDQLKSEKEVKNHICRVLASDKNDKARVMVEEHIRGEEFTVQCLVDKDNIIPTPAVQDFKKLLPGDKGPNTASMGSYADRGMLLPFMSSSDYDNAIKIIKATLKGFHDQTGDTCQGFLYGQFMLTEKSIKLIEYNFRPGDPEWVNTLLTFKGSLLDAVGALIEGRPYEWRFSGKASVCKYIVPKDYPEKLNSVLPVSFDPDLIQKIGAHIYYSCGRGEDGVLYPGTERGIAIAASADTVEKAAGIVEEAISTVEGEFAYRSDIGSTGQIEQKRVKTRK